MCGFRFWIFFLKLHGSHVVWIGDIQSFIYKFYLLWAFFFLLFISWICCSSSPLTFLFFSCFSQPFRVISYFVRCKSPCSTHWLSYYWFFFKFTFYIFFENIIFCHLKVSKLSRQPFWLFTFPDSLSFFCFTSFLPSKLTK